MMNKYQAIRLAKKAVKYPHQLTKKELEELQFLIKKVDELEFSLTDEQKALADTILGIKDAD